MSLGTSRWKRSARHRRTFSISLCKYSTIKVRLKRQYHLPRLRNNYPAPNAIKSAFVSHISIYSFALVFSYSIIWSSRDVSSMFLRNLQTNYIPYYYTRDKSSVLPHVNTHRRPHGILPRRIEWNYLRHYGFPPWNWKLFFLFFLIYCCTRYRLAYAAPSRRLAWRRKVKNPNKRLSQIGQYSAGTFLWWNGN